MRINNNYDKKNSLGNLRMNLKLHCGALIAKKKEYIKACTVN